MSCGVPAKSVLQRTEKLIEIKYPGKHFRQGGQALLR